MHPQCQLKLDHPEITIQDCTKKRLKGSKIIPLRKKKGHNKKTKRLKKNILYQISKKNK